MKKLIWLVFCCLILSTNAYAERLWSHTIHDGRDPFTPPQTKIGDCVNWIYPFGAKVCVGWSTKFKYMNSKIIIYVDGPSSEGVKNKIGQCGTEAVKSGVFAAVPAAIASGGAAAFNTFMTTAGVSFKTCVESIGSGFSIGYENPTGWTDWQ